MNCKVFIENREIKTIMSFEFLILNYTDMTNELLTIVGSPVRIIASN